MHNGDSSVPCVLTNYGIGGEVVDVIFDSITRWLRGGDLPWHQTRYINVFKGPENKAVAELLFFHYDGPPEREIGGGGEFNHCKMYLYEDKCNISFTGENSEDFCGITFKYSTPWVETNPGLLNFLYQYIGQHLDKIFNTKPARFNGGDLEVEHLKLIMNIIGLLVK